MKCIYVEFWTIIVFKDNIFMIFFFFLIFAYFELSAELSNGICRGYEGCRRGDDEEGGEVMGEYCYAA